MALETVVHWIEHGDASSMTPPAVSMLSMSNPVYVEDLEALTASAAYSERGRRPISYLSDDGDSTTLDSKSVSSSACSAADADSKLPKVPVSLFCLWVLNYVRDVTRDLLAEQEEVEWKQRVAIA